MKTPPLTPPGTPRYVRIYDNGGESIDRYTVVFTRNRPNGWFWYLAMNAAPYHPQGFGQHGESHELIDKPSYSYLGKKIPFEQLPEDCQKMTLETYQSIWG